MSVMKALEDALGGVITPESDRLVQQLINECMLHAQSPAWSLATWKLATKALMLILSRQNKELDQFTESCERLLKPRPRSEWDESMGDVLWWKFPIQESPHCGNPLDSEWPETPNGISLPEGYYTHFTPIPIPTLEESNADQSND